MLKEFISTEGHINIYCSVLFNHLDSHGKGQLKVNIEQSL